MLGARWTQIRADDRTLLPVLGAQEGYFVVPCSGNVNRDHGGELIPTLDRAAGLTRREAALVAVFWGQDAEREKIEQAADP